MRLGIITFAPASRPLFRPDPPMLARAVVAGSKTLGISSLIIASRVVVFSIVPEEFPLIGVSSWAIKGPIPTIAGSSSFKNLRSFT